MRQNIMAVRMSLADALVDERYGEGTFKFFAAAFANAFLGDPNSKEPVPAAECFICRRSWSPELPVVGIIVCEMTKTKQALVGGLCEKCFGDDSGMVREVKAAFQANDDVIIRRG